MRLSLNSYSRSNLWKKSIFDNLERKNLNETDLHDDNRGGQSKSIYGAQGIIHTHIRL